MLLLHQSVLGNRLDRRFEEDRRADADPAWRRRPDRADCRIGPPLIQDREECDTEGLSRCPARHVHHHEGPGERRASGIHQGRRGQAHAEWNQCDGPTALGRGTWAGPLMTSRATDKSKTPRAGHLSEDRSRQRSIPTGAPGQSYSDDLTRYLDRLLDEALEETFHASDAVAVPSRRELEKEKK